MCRGTGDRWHLRGVLKGKAVYCYRLAPACQVRRESFGLLFYDLRGPRLLFAETGDLLTPAELAAGISVEGAAGNEKGGRDRHQRLASLLSTLTKKGFLCEQQVC